MDACAMLMVIMVCMQFFGDWKVSGGVCSSSWVPCRPLETQQSPGQQTSF
jgi:hypothetical protein